MCWSVIQGWTINNDHLGFPCANDNIRNRESEDESVQEVGNYVGKRNAVAKFCENEKILIMVRKLS